ncbi:hypothetical protein D3C87_2082130 [compost metagenome]
MTLMIFEISADAFSIRSMAPTALATIPPDRSESLRAAVASFDAVCALWEDRCTASMIWRMAVEVSSRAAA